ncbi:MAG: hypothetical protein KDD60_07310 [Bdellovibrionales bacterium]|nr:hypothetical protein [Bdellovibrionales bacterium]
MGSFGGFRSAEVRFGRMPKAQQADPLTKQQIYVRILLVAAIVSFLLFSNIGLFSFIYEDGVSEPALLVGPEATIEVQGDHSIRIHERVAALQPGKKKFALFDRGFPVKLKEIGGFGKIQFPMSPSIVEASIVPLGAAGNVAPTALTPSPEVREGFPQVRKFLFEKFLFNKAEADQQFLKYESDYLLTGYVGYEQSAQPRAHLVLPVFHSNAARVKNAKVSIDMYSGVFASLMGLEIFKKGADGWKKLPFRKVSPSELDSGILADNQILVSVIDHAAGKSSLRITGLSREPNDHIYIHAQWPAGAPF